MEGWGDPKYTEERPWKVTCSYLYGVGFLDFAELW